MGGPIPQPGALPNCWILSLQVLPPMSSLLGPESLLFFWHLGLAGGYSQLPIPHCCTPLFKFLTLCLSSLSPLITAPFSLSPSSLSPKSLPLSTSYEYFVLPKTSTFWSSFFLNFIWPVNYILNILSVGLIYFSILYLYFFLVEGHVFMLTYID